MTPVLRLVARELRNHAPFTVLGAAGGIILMLAVVWTSSLPAIADVVERIFYTIHPLHVLLSAAVTTGLYRKHTRGRILPSILVGYAGSIGIATLSDSVIPFLGESLLSLPRTEAHIGFIERWWLVNPAALAGVAAALWRPFTRLPHSGHVFLSTGASLFHVMMALGPTVSLPQLLVIFAFLLLAVWAPVFLSDIAFPLAFARGRSAPEDAPTPPASGGDTG